MITNTCLTGGSPEVEPAGACFDPPAGACELAPGFDGRFAGVLVDLIGGAGAGAGVGSDSGASLGEEGGA